MNDKIEKNYREEPKDNTSNTPVERELVLLRKKYKDYLISKSLNPMKPVYLDLSLIYPDTDSIEELTNQVDDLKRCLDSFRPLTPTQAKNLEDVFSVEYTYNSNRIEGNTMTLKETTLVLEKGVTIQGKSMKEHLEVINHKQAFEYIKDLVEQKEEFTRRVLLDIHAIILYGDRENAGRFRREPVLISGSRHTPPDYVQVPSLIDSYFEYYEQKKNTLHPVILSADMSEKLVTIHPFTDGNGRASRLVMNLLLMRSGFPVTIISADEKYGYYDVLESVQVEEEPEAYRRYVSKKCYLDT
ncbi:MAG: Fic family protein [Candidatus Sericytochromatia bacterium]